MSYSDINTEKDTTMKNYKLILQYDGTRYSGWQKQGNTDNTIQAKLETIASKLTGVHAFGQVANFRCEESTLPPKFLRSEETVTDLIRDYFNNALPMDVRVLSVSEAPARFHARLNAKEKHYRYVIDNAAVPDVFTRRYAARIPVEQEARVSYDIEAMQRAANALIGEHDFKSFCDNRHMKKSTVRSIHNIRIVLQDDRITMDFYGNGFLYHMVRILVGTLLEVGSGKRSADDISRILQALDRREAGFTAPAQGLFLVEVTY